MLKVEGLVCRYGKVEAVRELTIEVRQGRARDADRCQRRRQDHDSEGDLGRAARRLPAASPSWARTSRGRARGAFSRWASPIARRDGAYSPT